MLKLMLAGLRFLTEKQLIEMPMLNVNMLSKLEAEVNMATLRLNLNH